MRSERRGGTQTYRPFPLPYRKGCVRLNLVHLVRSIPRCIREFWHRGRWGWAPSDTWSFDHYLCGVLGAGLVHMAEHASGWPAGYPGDYEAWTAILRKHGTALLDHAWGEMHDDGAEARGKLAGMALRWIADNHWSLWD